MRTLSKAEGSYIIALFDCCREKIKVPKANSSSAQSGTDENFIMTFGCPPTQTVAARSTIAKAYFTFMRDASDDEGILYLPGNLNYWGGDDGKCEHAVKVPGGAIELKWHDSSNEVGNLIPIMSVTGEFPAVNRERSLTIADVDAFFSSTAKAGRKKAYDFTKPIREPAWTLFPDGTRNLKTIKFIHDFEYIIMEGPAGEGTLEVY